MKGFLFALVVVLSISLFSGSAFALTDGEAIDASTKFILEHSKPVHFGVLITEYKVAAKEVSRVDTKTFVSLEIYSYRFGFKRSRDVTVQLDELGKVTTVFVMKAKKAMNSVF